MIQWKPGLIGAVTCLFLAACGGGGKGSSGSESGSSSVDANLEHTVTGSSEGGGVVSPSSLKVADNGTAEFTLIPDEGHSIGSVTGCAGEVKNTTFVVEPVTTGCTFQASFEPALYDIRALVEEGGTVEPMEKQVGHGEYITFTITLDDGFRIDDISGCNGHLDGNTYTTGSVTEVCYVEVSFTAERPYDVIVQERHQSATVQWQGVSGADSYNLYYATEPGVNPSNYNTLAGGAVLESVSSPFELTGLTNGTTYYLGITAVDGSTETDPSKEVKLTPPGSNDTGLTQCSDATGDYFSCQVPAFPGQDAEFGRDNLLEYGLLHKVGGGVASFDYTKIGSDGTPLAIQDVEWWPTGTEAEGMRWSCVQDNVTGLMWEVKSDIEFTLRDYRNEYSWYDSSIPLGMDNNGSCHESQCDTEGYAQAVNAEALCGYSDWRLPTERELLGLLYIDVYAPLIDRSYFPNTVNGSYWTSHPSSGTAGEARYLNFKSARNGFYSQWVDLPVRLVRTAD